MKNPALNNLIQQVKSEKKYQTKITPTNFDLDGHSDLIKAIAGNEWDFSDKTIVNVFKLLLTYFNGIESEKYDLNKGILLIGNVGTGKTSTMRIFAEYLGRTNNPNYFKFVESRMIIREFAKDKYSGMERYSFNERPDEHGTMHKKPSNLCIDDLGLEKQEAKHYGETVDVMGEFLADRYSIFIDERYRKLTHATSNLSTDSLASLYGERLYDRFVELFNIILLTGKSKRK